MTGPQFSRQGGRPPVTTRIITDDPAGLLGFLSEVFGVAGAVDGDRPVELWFGDSLIMVSDGGGVWDPFPAFVIVHVEDTDSAYARAVAAGATAVDEPADMPWGDRRGTVRDRWGNVWQLATVLS